MINLTRMIVALVAIAGLSFLAITPTAQAVSARDFNPGRIIDDAVFYNKSAMGNAQAVQDFLNTHVPACDTWGTGPSGYGSLTRAQYAQRMGWHAPPYACLQNYHENPTTGETSFEKGGGAFAGGQSAAQIIWNASQEYGINPQVLLVMLRKESAGPLTSDNWPLKSQYKYAMGYGCPDSGPGYSANCAADKGGFYNQMRLAAWQLRYYANNINTYNYRPGRTNYIQYSPDPNCGGKNVFIENIATASLYIYTPYVPNQAALDSYPGTASCGAYGNRNFFMMFNDWFGSTTGKSYDARYVGQAVYPADPFYLGESRQMYLDYANAGSSRWYDDTSVPAGLNPVHLAASVPTNRSSAFSYGWPSDGRPNFNFSKVYQADGVTLASNQHVVEPGQIARFEFPITPAWSLRSGMYREHFQPVLEGSADWNMGGIAWFDLNVTSRYKAQFSSQSPYPRIVKNSDVATSYFRFKNSGSAAWYDTVSVPYGYSTVQLSTAESGRQSKVSSGWPSRTTASRNFSKVYQADGVTLASNQHVVMPGQIGEFTFDMVANDDISEGVRREYFQPTLVDPYNPYLGVTAWMDITVSPSATIAQFQSQSAFPSINRGQPSSSFLQYKNSGTSRWYDDTSVPAGLNPVHLAASVPTNRSSAFSYGWPSDGRPNFNFSKVYQADGVTLASNQHVVEPGQIARFEFPITAPWNINYGTHREYFQPVLEYSKNWNIGALSWLDITIR